VTLRAVLFDAGNTLLFLDYPRLARGVAEATGVPLSGAELEAQAGPAALALERSDTSDRERAGRYLETLFRLAGVPDSSMAIVRDTLLGLHREKHLWAGVKAGTVEALERLRAAGYRLAVISNSDGRAVEGLAAAGLLAHFEEVIDSDLVGCEKPDPRIFLTALERMGLSPLEALYVGDIYEVDVVGARRAGLDVILLDPVGHHRGRDVRVAGSLREVVEIILAQAGTMPPAAAPRTPDS
jgi:putative hydrolase of the HAD superfamily